METTRKAYLRTLRRMLLWRVPPVEGREVVSDYDAFFADGLAEGKTEADLCAQFGAPRTAALAVLREEGRSDGRRGLLALVWTVLAAWLNSSRTWNRFTWNQLGLFYAIQLLLVPVLYLLWRRSLGTDVRAVHKGWEIAFWAVPAAAFAAVYGFGLWLMQVVLLPPEAAVPAWLPGNAGRLLGQVYDAAGLVIVLTLLAALLRCWWDGTPRYLPPAAWCVGALCAMCRQKAVFTSMDVSCGLESVMGEITSPPLLVLALVGAGGAALTALLVWIGGRHGRAA